MAKQEIKHINIKDLVLWTENPRDSINENATDQDIAQIAISKDGRSKWNLKNLFESMGDWYDTSELPTVVCVDGKPVVYDGNRRVLIGKIKYGRVNIEHKLALSQFDFPEEIPCNVCDKATALENIERKHIKDSSWKTLERDIFKHKHMGKEKSIFLAIDEATGIISNNPFMNQRFVKDEIFSTKNLKELGISMKNGGLRTPYNSEDLKVILNEITELVYSKKVSTRENRGKVVPFLEQDVTIKNIILNNKGNAPQPYTGPTHLAFTPRTPKKEIPLFGKKLNLKLGKVNNLYRDLRDMHDEWEARNYSEHFPMIIGIGLRLLCEVSETELNPQSTTKLIEHCIKRHFDDAKNARTKKEREFFNTNSLGDLSQSDMISLLQKSGHPSSDTMTNGQTIVLSIILGKILEKTHGKGK